MVKFVHVDKVIQLLTSIFINSFWKQELFQWLSFLFLFEYRRIKVDNLITLSDKVRSMMPVGTWLNQDEFFEDLCLLKLTELFLVVNTNECDAIVICLVTKGTPLLFVVLKNIIEIVFSKICIHRAVNFKLLEVNIASVYERQFGII